MYNLSLYMELFGLDRVLEEVAIINGTTQEAVRKGIAKAIDAAWCNPNPQIHEIWKEMSPHGDCPTVEGAVLYLSTMVATIEYWSSL